MSQWDIVEIFHFNKSHCLQGRIIYIEYILKGIYFQWDIVEFSFNKSHCLQRKYSNLNKKVKSDFFQWDIVEFFMDGRIIGSIFS